MAGLLMCVPGHGEELAAAIEFNPAMLRSPVDTRVFARGNPTPEGRFESDLYVNKLWKGRARIELQKPAGSPNAIACFDAPLLDLLGFDSNNHSLRSGELRCEALSSLVEGARADYDASAFRLDVTAAQALLRRTLDAPVDPSLWDRGVTAATLQYAYNGFSTGSALASRTHSQYLSLRGGFNWQDWRLRLNGALASDAQNGFQYRHSQTYLQRSLVDWRSSLTIGDAVTDGRVFESIGFRGIRLSSDDRMFADSRRGFAPVIRGIANSNARVRVVQRGIPIHEITVPAGAFVIDDLYPTGSGGDLQVTVTEADGTERSFSVPFSNVIELVRPGATRYELTVGRFRNPASSSEPYLLQGNWRRGFSNWLTGYTGLFLADGYAAAAVGSAMNTPVGAVSADATLARSETGGGARHLGHSLRASYSRMLSSTNTQLSLAAYRYSSRGFYSASEAFLMRDALDSCRWLPGVPVDARKHRYQLSISQPLPDAWGVINLTATGQKYWHRSGSENEFQLSYARQFGQIGVSFNLGRARRLDTGTTENRGMLSVSIPLDGIGASRASGGAGLPTYRAGLSTAGGSPALDQSLSGTLGETRQYSYSAFTSTAPSAGSGRTTTSWGGSGAWSTPYAVMNGSFSRSSEYSQYSAGIAGALVAYSGGVVLAPALGDTAAIVTAEHAGGARISNYSGLRLDGNGQAVVASLSPFRRNAVEIDTQGLSTDVGLRSGNQNVVPTAGAVVVLKFDTEVGYSVLLNASLEDGSRLPFGAQILDATGASVGFMGQAGKALVRVSALSGALTISWGEDAHHQCVLEYWVAQEIEPDPMGYRRVEGRCMGPGKARQS
ncbi:fimbria/pilus outer membrane usher protein [Diaphorobacter aerolatus]|uniref:Fimbrial biogenesis outer membrane usher protein n=1 Tax=Diaphorobacter aerolatus TaxID=1288495 RepID=A0A7H0GHE0_9BURK|nr:fimbria/pilus outer membrane usher protein [Diaphorobacter aerolatus]QNP47706.1 fimbrial biogenesis outer membrane usher protein [Diaphorobacter aerolatus]